MSDETAMDCPACPECGSHQGSTLHDFGAHLIACWFCWHAWEPTAEERAQAERADAVWAAECAQDEIDFDGADAVGWVTR